MKQLTIRQATAEDAALLADLGRRTFYDAFAKDNTPENMEAYLSSAFTVEQMVSELADPDSRFLIADLDGIAVGYTKVKKCQQPPEGIESSKVAEIERVYVVQDMLGAGVSNMLMQASLNEAQQLGCDTVWLGVWERNPRAIAFYRRWGFKEFGTHIFQVGDDPQTDLLMQRRVLENIP